MVTTAPQYFVTNDKWLRLPGGVLDKTDKQILKDIGKNVMVVNMTEMLDLMQQEDPAKFKEFHKEQNKIHGKILTVPELYELASKANETMQQFEQLANLISDTLAQKIRKWRVEEHLTWRAISRRISGFDSNQLMGMALCQRAAQMCNENYQIDPWN